MGYGGGGYGGGGGGGGGGYGGYHSIEAAVYSHHKTDVIPVPSHKSYPKPTYVDVPSGVQPVYLNFQSQSSPVYVKQKHYGMSGSYQTSHSYDEPHHLKHVVTKPVIQEVHEVIKPVRKVVQTIKPVSIAVFRLEPTLTATLTGPRGGDDTGAQERWLRRWIRRRYGWWWWWWWLRQEGRIWWWWWGNEAGRWWLWWWILRLAEKSPEVDSASADCANH